MIDCCFIATRIFRQYQSHLIKINVSWYSERKLIKFPHIMNLNSSCSIIIINYLKTNNDIVIYRTSVAYSVQSIDQPSPPFLPMRNVTFMHNSNPNEYNKISTRNMWTIEWPNNIITTQYHGPSICRNVYMWMDTHKREPKANDGKTTEREEYE